MDDALSGLVAYGVATFLLWLATRGDKNVKAQWRRPFGVLFRMGVLVLALHLVILGLPYPPVVVYILIGAVFVSAFCVSVWGLNGMDLLCFITLFAVYQWAFWFPETGDGVGRFSRRRTRKRKDENKAATTPAPLRIGHAITDLKPVGTILLDGEEVPATSTRGLIAQGEQVVVVKSGGFEVKVRRLDPINDVPNPADGDKNDR